MYDSIVPRSVREALLKRACARNLPIEVSLVGHESYVLLKSRLLRGGAAGEPLLIEAPTHSGRTVAVRTREQLQVLLMVEGDRYGFQAPVSGRGRMKLSNDVEVTAVILGYPETIVKLQRRHSYRVKIPTVAPMPVNCIARGRGSRGPQTKEAGLVQFDATALDISSGGLGLKIPPRFSNLATTGSRWAVGFALPGLQAPIKLLAEVRHSRRLAHTRDCIAGVQFINWDKTLAGRRAVNAITRFVARRQREELKKLSGLE